MLMEKNDYLIKYKLGFHRVSVMEISDHKPLLLLFGFLSNKA